MYKLDRLFTFGNNKLFLKISNTPIKIEKGFYLAINGHEGYSDVATFQLFNVTGYFNESNDFYPAKSLYNDKPAFLIYYNPVTCEIRTALSSEKLFVLYNIDETHGL